MKTTCIFYLPEFKQFLFLFLLSFIFILTYKLLFLKEKKEPGKERPSIEDSAFESLEKDFQEVSIPCDSFIIAPLYIVFECDF